MEAYLRLGTNLIDAVDRAEASLLGEMPQAEGAPAPERVPTPAENDAALAELQKLMGGLA